MRKNSVLYEHKSIYLDPEDEYQRECIRLLNLCSRFNGKILGIIVHEFIKDSNLDLENAKREDITSFIRNYKEFRRIPSEQEFPLAFYDRKMGKENTVLTESSDKKSLDKGPTELNSVPSEQDLKEPEEDVSNDLMDALSMFGIKM